MKKSELFEAFDLFDVRDFGKVRMLLIVSQVIPVFSAACTEKTFLVAVIWKL